MTNSAILILSILSILITQSQRITVTGPLVDLWCWDDNNFIALDTKTSLKTDPYDHTIHCLWEVSFCRNSGFAIVHQPNGAGDYEIQYVLDDEGNTAANTAMSQLSMSQKGFEFSWTGCPDTATAADGSYRDGRPILRTCSAAPSAQTYSPSSAPTSVGRDCLVGDIIYQHGGSIGVIGYTCKASGDKDNTEWDGKEGKCVDGEVVDYDYTGDCGTVGADYLCCQTGEEGTIGGAVCVTECSDQTKGSSNANRFNVGVWFLMLVLSILW